MRWQAVIVDDGSTNDTPELLRSWAGQLSLIQLAQPAGGKYRAVNRELKAAERELVVFTDDDVIPHPTG